MEIESFGNLLLGCAVVNYAILLIWFVAFTKFHDEIYQLHSKWFRLSVEHFDAINYGGMAIYKIGVLLFNVAPLIALRFF